MDHADSIGFRSHSEIYTPFSPTMFVGGKNKHLGFFLREWLPLQKRGRFQTSNIKCLTSTSSLSSPTCKSSNSDPHLLLSTKKRYHLPSKPMDTIAVGGFFGRPAFCWPDITNTKAFFKILCPCYLRTACPTFYTSKGNHQWNSVHNFSTSNCKSLLLMRKPRHE